MPYSPICEREIACLAGLSARLERASYVYAHAARDGTFEPHGDGRIERRRLEL